MKKILLFTVALIACSYSAFSQDVYFTDQNTSIDKSRMTASVYCSEDVTVVFEVMTSPNSINRDCSASFMIINSSNYVYDYLPAGSASTRKPITVNLKQGKSFVEITASSASAILLISTVNGKPHSAMPLTLFANN